MPPPAEPEPDWWPPRDRAAAIEQARQARSAEGGLPVDDATLQRVADAVLDPNYAMPGLFYTPEEADDEVPDEVLATVGAYLRDHPGIDGGQRVGWLDGRATLFVGIVGDPAAHATAVAKLSGGRAVVEARGRTEDELNTLADRIVEDDDELGRAGYSPLVISPDPSEGFVEVEVAGGSDGETAQKFFETRYGPAVRVQWLGPSVLRKTPQPFGSWAAEGRRLRIYFGLDHNGEQFGSATAEEVGDRVVVSLMKLEPVGPTTLIGGFQALHADLDLAQPVGDRPVVDASTGEARPSVAQLRDR